MTLFDAGLNIIYTLMNLDGAVDEHELQEMIKYLIRANHEIALSSTKVMGANMDMMTVLVEIGLLSSLTDEALLAKYLSSIDFFNENADFEQKSRMMDFALSMIAADGVISTEEEKEIRHISDCWGVDTKLALSRLKWGLKQSAIEE